MESKEFIDGLKRDKARGNLAPHQIILLISLLNLYKENESDTFDILSLTNEFQKIWNDYQYKFKTINNNIGLPLKAFNNRGYIELGVKDTINDFRNNLELMSKISSLKIDNVLIQLFKNEDIRNYFIHRISK